MGKSIHEHISAPNLLSILVLNLSGVKKCSLCFISIGTVLLWETDKFNVYCDDFCIGKMYIFFHV
jgi:hypothetical protein